MSAFMVGKPHIDALVSLALWGPGGREVAPGRWFRPSWFSVPVEPDTPMAVLNQAHRQAEPESADAIGQMLADANARSVRHRYADADAIGMIEGWAARYRYRGGPSSRRPTAVEGLKAIACFRYQACEHPEWPQSEASRFCDALEHALIGCLPGYDDAPWEWHG